jgi:uncharacterized protein YbgA (DUF1722 family)
MKSFIGPLTNKSGKLIRKVSQTTINNLINKKPENSKKTMLTHYKTLKIGPHDVVLHFQGYFKNEVRVRVSVDRKESIVDFSDDGEIRDAALVKREFHALFGNEFDVLLEEINRYYREVPKRSDSTAPAVIMQPFHVHEYTLKTQVPGLDRCHSTGEVLLLLKRLWPKADFYEGGHHVVARIGGRYIEIHETWDAQTCLGSPSRSNEEADKRSFLQRFFDKIFPRKVVLTEE